MARTRISRKQWHALRRVLHTSVNAPKFPPHPYPWGFHSTTWSSLERRRLVLFRFAFGVCYVQLTDKGRDAAHQMHNHPNNFLSGVYYVRTNKGADTINFHDPRSQTEIIRPPVTALTAENTDQVVVEVRNGTVLIFPSWLAHSVDVNRSDETRISISFNGMFSAYAEKMSKPLW